MQEMPQLASTAYASSAFNMRDLMTAAHQPNLGVQSAVWLGDITEAVAKAVGRQHEPAKQNPTSGTKPMAISPRRLVQVFIADPDESVSLADCLLYSGEQKLTDLTDQELFFEVDIKSILDTHNTKRVTLVNKTIKERTELLEPARIRDLKMTVVTIAQF